MGRLKGRVGNQDDLGFMPRFQALYPIPFFVQQVGRDLDWQLRNNFRSTFLARLFADDAQDS